MSWFGSRPSNRYWKRHKNEFTRQINDSMWDIRSQRFDEEEEKLEEEKKEKKGGKKSSSKKDLKK